MLYKFTCRAAQDLLMLEPHAQALLQIIGKRPEPQGVLRAAELPQALAALKAAVAAERQQARSPSGPRTDPPPVAGALADDEERSDPVTLAQRAWPLMHMMERGIAENRDIVWGV